MCAVYTAGFISTAEEPATGDEGISAKQVLAFPSQSLLSSLNKRELSRFPKMTLTHCDGWCLIFPHDCPSSSPAPLSACGDAPAKQEGKEQAAQGLDTSSS